MRHGRLAYDGETVVGRRNAHTRVYRTDTLLKARQNMADAEAAAVAPPEGFVDFDGAARFFHVHPLTINHWQREGKLGRGTVHKIRGFARRHVFAISELKQARDRMNAKAERPVAPDGFIDLHAAAERTGVSAHRCGSTN